MKRFPTGAKVGTVSATAKRSSTTVTVHVSVSLKAPKGQWRAGVLVSLLCGDRSLSGSSKTIRFTAPRRTRSRSIGASIRSGRHLLRQAPRGGVGTGVENDAPRPPDVGARARPSVRPK